MIPDLVLLSILSIAETIHKNGHELFLVNSPPPFEESLRTKRIDRLLRVCNETEAIQEVGGVNQGDSPLRSAYLQSVFDRANVTGTVEVHSSRGRKARPVQDEYIKLSRTDKGLEVWTSAKMLDDGAEMTLPYLQVLSKYAGDTSVTLNLSELKFLGEVVINGMFKARQACTQAGHEFSIVGCAGQPSETLRCKRLLR
jgi:anti-anti-sigma regulatory factor